MSLKVRLKDEMNKRGVKVPALSIQTGIPKDRIYAWYRDDTNPKNEDRVILEKWMSGNGYEETPTNGSTRPQETQHGDKSEILALMRERLDDLKEDKEWLKKQMEASLAGLHLGQKSILAHVATILEKDDERDSAGSKRKEQSLKDETGKRIVDKVSGISQMDTSQSR